MFFQHKAFGVCYCSITMTKGVAFSKSQARRTKDAVRFMGYERSEYLMNYSEYPINIRGASMNNPEK